MLCILGEAFIYICHNYIFRSRAIMFFVLFLFFSQVHLSFYPFLPSFRLIHFSIFIFPPTGIRAVSILCVVFLEIVRNNLPKSKLLKVTPLMKTIISVYNFLNLQLLFLCILILSVFPLKPKSVTIIALYTQYSIYFSLSLCFLPSCFLLLSSGLICLLPWVKFCWYQILFSYIWNDFSLFAVDTEFKMAIIFSQPIEDIHCLLISTVANE